jgi:hypothetical protein
VGSFLTKLKIIIISPVIQNIWAATITPGSGSGSPSLTLMELGILINRYTNAPKVSRELIRDSLENRLEILM